MGASSCSFVSTTTLYLKTTTYPPSSLRLQLVPYSSMMRDVGSRLAASAGAACHSSGGGKISSVLRAMKVPEEYARGTLRLSVGPGTTEEEVDGAVDILVGAARKQLSGA